METLTEAKEYIKANYQKGCVCPVCTQYVKLYRRSLTSSMCYALILIYKARFGDFIHVEDYLKEKNCPSSIRGDFPKLHWFGLIESYKGTRSDGSSRNGYWKITTLGEKFVEGSGLVPAAVYLFNNRMYRTDPKLISITAALGKKFNYSELMA